MWKKWPKMNRLLNKIVDSPSLDLFTTWRDLDKPHVTLKMLLLEKEMGAEVLSNRNYSLVPHLHPIYFWKLKESMESQEQKTIWINWQNYP